MLGTFKKKRNPWHLWLVIIAIIFLALVGTALMTTVWYSRSLQPVSTTAETRYFTVEPGNGLHQIATKLKRENLIRSGRAFEYYVRNNGLHDELQAGTYEISSAMSVEQIVQKMIKGEVARNLITILPAKRLDQIKDAFKKAGYNQQMIDRAFEPDQYARHPALASLPAGASLEGYLYPESFQKEAETPAEVIVRLSLDEMHKHLTPAVLKGIRAQGLSVYQGITLASIIAQESDDVEVQPKMAQVFLLRLKQDIPLGADPTAAYASYLAGKNPDLAIDSAYNTRVRKGLPPGPIGNVTADALRAVANPTKTDYLFFVSGDDGKTYFSHTQSEHDELVRKHCRVKCDY